jgi:hypothetical protein
LNGLYRVILNVLSPLQNWMSARDVSQLAWSVQLQRWLDFDLDWPLRYS